MQLQVPYSYQNVNSATFCNNLPQGNTVVPNLPEFSGQLQAIVPIAAGMLRKVLQDNAALNALRAFCYNRMATNNFMNPDFENGVRLVARYTLALLQSRSTTDPQQAAYSAADTVCKIDLGYALRMFPVLMQVVSPDIITSLSNVDAANSQMMAVINQYAGNLVAQPQQAQWGGQQPQWGQPQQPQWGGQAQWGGQQPQQNVNWGAGNNSLWNNQGNGAWNAAPVNTGPTSGAGWGSLDVPAPDQSAPAPVNNQGTWGGTPSAIDVAWGGGVNNNTAQTEVVEMYTDVAVEPEQDHPEHWIPTPQQPHHTAYNPMTHRSDLLLAPNGNLEQRVTMHESRAATMDYLRLELDPTVLDEHIRNLTPEDDLPPRVDDWDRLTNIEVPVDIADNVPSQIDFSKDCFVRDYASANIQEAMSFIDAHSDDEAVVETIFDEQSVFTGSASVEAFYTDVTNMLHDPEASYEEVLNLVHACRGDLSVMQYENIRRRMTDTVNWLLRGPLGIPGIHIDDLVTDYKELIEVLLEEHGDVIVQGFLETVHNFIVRVFGARVSRPETGKRFALVAPVYLARVPWASSDMWLQIDYNGSVIVPSLLPDLHAAVLAGMRRAEKQLNCPSTRIQESKIRRYLIQTTDRALFEVYRAGFNKDAILIGVAKL